MAGFGMSISVERCTASCQLAIPIFFAESPDLEHWHLLPLECVYSKEKYTACPALRFVDGLFYMIYLEARPGPTYESHIVQLDRLS